MDTAIRATLVIREDHADVGLRDGIRAIDQFLPLALQPDIGFGQIRNPSGGNPAKPVDHFGMLISDILPFAWVSLHGIEFQRRRGALHYVAILFGSDLTREPKHPVIGHHDPCTGFITGDARHILGRENRRRRFKTPIAGMQTKPDQMLMRPLCRTVDERQQRTAIEPLGDFNTGGGHRCRHQIEQRGQLAGPTSLPNAFRPIDHQRHTNAAQRILPLLPAVRRIAGKCVIARNRGPVVGAKDNHGVVQISIVLQLFNDAADALIHGKEMPVEVLQQSGGARERFHVFCGRIREKRAMHGMYMQIDEKRLSLLRRYIHELHCLFGKGFHVIAGLLARVVESIPDIEVVVPLRLVIVIAVVIVKAIVEGMVARRNRTEITRLIQ